jgi:hypothetical protein
MTGTDDGWDAERRDVMSAVATPAYRQFCSDLELPFHFWDELPESSFDVKISAAENRLHPEARSLFNLFGPWLALHRGAIIRFKFDVAYGSVDVETMGVDAFLGKVEDSEIELARLRNRLGIVAGILSAAFGLTVVVLAARFLPFWPQLDTFVLVAIAGFSIWLHQGLIRMPSARIQGLRRQQIEARLVDLRHRLDEIRGDRPRPQVPNIATGPGSALVHELRKEVGPKEFWRMVWRLQRIARHRQGPEG